MKQVTLLLGAEGCSELQEEPWLREATQEERDAFEVEVGRDFMRGASRDGTGRPYFLMTVLDSAPADILEAANSKTRAVRLP